MSKAQSQKPGHRIIIFDTTLRDGEQAPGAGMTVPEKVQIAHQLARLGVDVIEAGFPISSPAQAEAVSARRGAAGGQSGQLVGAFRVDAIVLVGDKIWLRRRWISMRGGSSSALPWRVLRTEPPRVLMKDSLLLGGSIDA